MTDDRLREIFREELASFFGQLEPKADRFEGDLNILAAEGPEGLLRACKARMKERRAPRRMAA